jgi:hypothetical protein
MGVAIRDELNPLPNATAYNRLDDQETMLAGRMPP